MQKDMHFYGVYALARAAGIKPEAALTIAYASQFVDDAIDDDAVILSGQTAILPAMTSHMPLDYENSDPGDQWRVWMPFHFLPGNEAKDGNFYARMTCRKNSKPAQKMLDDALQSKNSGLWPHLIGVVSHVYADTFSHFGFIGFAHRWNKVHESSVKVSEKHSRSIRGYIGAKFEEFKTRFAGNFAEIIPVGHGSVGTFPDRPYLKWSFKYENNDVHAGSDTDRDNSSNFLEGAKCLYDFFSKYAEVNPKDKSQNDGRKWDDISDHISGILVTEAPEDERIKRWRDAVSSGAICGKTEQDRNASYSDGLWRPRRAEYQGGNGKIKELDAYKFINAATHHRDYVLNGLLPSLGLIA